MDHINDTISRATPAQIARAASIAADFAALSGLQSWSGATDARLALYNIVQNDARPAPKLSAEKAPFTVRRLVPLTAAGVLHSTDRARLVSFIRALPDTAEAVHLFAPATGFRATLSREDAARFIV